jgi:hypothetical protein
MATYESKKYTFSGAGITSIDADQIADTTVSNTEYQYINSLSANAQTQIADRLQLSTGGSFADSINVDFGAGTDLRLTSDGTSGLLKGNALEMQTSTGAEYLTATASGAVDIYHNGTKKFETSAAGATVSGTATATTFSGSGASLTSLPAANLTGGPLPALNGAAITNLTAANLSGTSGAMNGAAITSLNASNLASGTVPDARLPASALSSDYVKLGTATTGGSAASSLALAGSPGGFSSDYKHYKIILDGKWQTSGTAATYFGLRISTDAGSSYASSGYFFAQLMAASNANNWTYEDTTMLKFARYIPYSSTSPTTRNLSSEITIFDANGSDYKPVAAAGAGFDRNQDGIMWQIVGGVIETTSAIDGVQFVVADGSNISAGSSFTLYGLK